MTSFSSLLLDRTELSASALGGDGATQLLTVMNQNGMIKASVKTSPQALEEAVYALQAKFQMAIRALDAAAEQLLHAGGGGGVMRSIMQIGQKLAAEASGMWFIYEKRHKQTVQGLVAQGRSEKEAHTLAVEALREGGMWSARGLPGAPTAMHGVAMATLAGGAGGGQLGKQADSFSSAMIGAVKSAVASAVASAGLGAGGGGGGGGERGGGNRLCHNCYQKGHMARDCTNPEVCSACRKPGHRRGDAECEK